jgi:hypothetical protein
MDDRSQHPLLSVYARLLRLYPPEFQRQFSDEMLETFSQILADQGPLAALLMILSELFPTLLHEHLDDSENLSRLIRRMLCPIPALILYAIAVRRVQHLEEFVLCTFWLICLLAALWKSGCRGRVCLLRTMGASILGMLLPLALINSYQAMTPGFFSLAVPIGLFAMTIGLILGLFARLIMEGLSFHRSAIA